MQRPTFRQLRFSCAYCGAYTHHHWGEMRSVEFEKNKLPTRWDKELLEELGEEQKKLPIEKRYSDYARFPEYLESCNGKVMVSKFRSDPYSFAVYNVETSRCDSCDEVSIWLQDRLVYPVSGPLGAASKDMPETVTELYDEASAVFSTSPKAAAALLRLALQHLMIELGEKGKNIHEDINSLIDKGLDESVSKIMHALRIIGNESVHPGTISVDDDPEMAEGLFDILNQVVEEMITRPRKREELWNKLPQSKKAPVEKKIADRKQKNKEK